MRNKLSLRNAGALLIIIQISKFFLFGFPGKARGDTWISILLLLLSVAPLMLLYARLVCLMPGKDLYQMMDFVFGRVISVIVCVGYAYYFLTLSSIINGNFVEFVHLISLYKTSFVTINLAVFMICFYLAHSGSETMGKWATCVTIFTFLVLAVVLFFSASKMKLDNIMPILDQSWAEIGRTSYMLFAQPFGETIMLLCLIGDLDKKAGPYKLFVGGTLISLLVCLIVYCFTCAMLGQNNLDTFSFPSYKATSVIHIGSVGTRIEALVGFAFILHGVTKVAICLVAGIKAVTSISKIKEHWTMVFPVGFLCAAMSTFVFHNVIENFEFLENVYIYYAPAFQAVIPVVLWIAAEIKCRSGENIPKAMN